MVMPGPQGNLVATVKRTCALCTDLVPETTGTYEALGKNNGMVFVCAGCTTKPPKRRLGPERGYEPTGGFMMAREATAGMRAAGVPSKGLRPLLGANLTCASVTPGHVLVRVKHVVGMDQQAAWESLRGHPFFRHLRVLGSDTRYFLFEYPNPEARLVRDIPSPVEGLEPWRVRQGEEEPTQPKRRSGGIYAEANGANIEKRRSPSRGTKRTGY